MPMHIEPFFDPDTWTLTYLLMDGASKQAVIIDSVLDYDPKSGRTSTASADRLLERIKALSARVEWILETHVHADHFTAIPYLKEKLGSAHPAKSAMGSDVTAVQSVFKALFNVGDDFTPDGAQFDHLFADQATFALGALQGKVLHTPGHTPACSVYVFTDPAEPDAPACFVGDTLFMPDYGTARCDFPGGSARTLYRSIQKVLALPAATKLYMCHDYLPNGRTMQYVTTVAEMKAHNIHVREGISEEAFVAMREERDKTLDMPVLILPSVQVNMRAGQLPQPESNGLRYIKIPLNAV